MSACCLCHAAIAHPRDEYGPWDVRVCRDCWFQHSHEATLRLVAAGEDVSPTYLIAGKPWRLIDILAHLQAKDVTDARAQAELDQQEKQSQMAELEEEIGDLEDMIQALTEEMKLTRPALPPAAARLPAIGALL